MNICAKCKHCRPPTHLLPGWICKHPELENAPWTSPVTGIPCYRGSDDQGRPAPIDDRHPDCLSVNRKGDCGFYEAKD